jgi:hypothetical protein
VGSILISAVCATLESLLKTHVIRTAEVDEHLLKDYHKNRDKLCAEIDAGAHPIDVNKFTTALKRQLINEHGLLRFEDGLHFEGGVLVVEDRGGSSYKLSTRERKPSDLFSAETCVPYDIRYIQAAIGCASSRLECETSQLGQRVTLCALLIACCAARSNP